MEPHKAAKQLGEEFTFIHRFLGPVIEGLALPREAKILDVGTGMGRTAISLALHGYHVVTGEPAEDDTEYGKQPWRPHAHAAGVEHLIRFQPFEAEHLPFEDASFDAVFAVGALHHMQSPGAAMAELLRATVPDGVICILEPNAALLERVHDKHPSHPDPVDPRPLVGGRPVQLTRTEMFDVYVVTNTP